MTGSWTACSCTNQCPTCGACCQITCAHRASAGTYVFPTFTTPQYAASPAGGGIDWLPTSGVLPLPTPAPSEVHVHYEISREDIRKIVREEIREALRDLGKKARR